MLEDSLAFHLLFPEASNLAASVSLAVPGPERGSAADPFPEEFVVVDGKLSSLLYLLLIGLIDILANVLGVDFGHFAQRLNYFFKLTLSLQLPVSQPLHPLSIYNKIKNIRTE